MINTSFDYHCSLFFLEFQFVFCFMSWIRSEPECVLEASEKVIQ